MSSRTSAREAISSADCLEAASKPGFHEADATGGGVGEEIFEFVRGHAAVFPGMADSGFDGTVLSDD